MSKAYGIAGSKTGIFRQVTWLPSFAGTPPFAKPSRKDRYCGKSFGGNKGTRTTFTVQIMHKILYQYLLCRQNTATVPVSFREDFANGGVRCSGASAVMECGHIPHQVRPSNCHFQQVGRQKGENRVTNGDTGVRDWQTNLWSYEQHKRKPAAVRKRE